MNDKIKVINFSVGGESLSQEVYDAIVDYTNKGGLLVCAAGNDNRNIDNSNQYMYPASYGNNSLSNCIENILVVGALDAYGNDRRSTSNWGENTVDIYAPGGAILSTVPMDLCGINIANCNIGEGHQEYGYHVSGGTSMATPYVTGVVALLLSVNPDLNASQLKECIINGADIISITLGDGTTQNVKRLNAWGSFKYLMNHYFSALGCQLGYEDVQLFDSIDENAEYFAEHTSMVKVDVITNGDFAFTISSDSEIIIEFYDSDFEKIEVSQIKSRNNSTVQFTNTLTKGVYYLKTNYANEFAEGDITVFVDCPTHIHNYNAYARYSKTQHIEACECGVVGINLSPHVVRLELIENHRAICIYCGAIVLLGNDFAEVPLTTAIKVTINGSFILPDGIIVLVEEDIEAYLAGTLIFYNKDNLPVVQ